MAAASPPTTTTTTTTTTAFSDPAPRFTPSPACLYPVPSDSVRDRGLCSDAYATSWRRCPTGYTSACRRTVNYGLTRSTTIEPPATDPTDPTTTAAFTTKYYDVICCPDPMPWVCGGRHVTETSCALAATASTVFHVGAALEPYTVSSAQMLYAYGVTASQAGVAMTASWAVRGQPSTVVEMASATAWCDLPTCAGLDLASVLYNAERTATVVPGDSSVPRPPQHMGELGSLGIFAVSGLLGAVVFAAALLLPSAVEYRKRKRLQVQGQ